MRPLNPATFRPDPVALLAAGLGVLALLLPWVELKPSRIALGEGIGAFAKEPAVAAGLLLLGLLLPFARKSWASIGLALWVLAWTGLTASMSNSLLAGQPEVARVSPAAGFWIALLALYVFAFALRVQGWWVILSPTLVLVVMLGLGAFAKLAPIAEYQSWRDQFGTELWRHLALSGAAVIQAVLVGVPLGVLASRGQSFNWILGVTGFLQTIPSLALFGLLLPFLANLSRDLRLEVALGILVTGAFAIRLLWAVGRPLALVVAVPLVLLGLVLGGVWINNLIGPEPLKLVLGAPLQESGVRGIGTAPAVLALTLYALLPVVSAVYTGLRNVPEAALDAGRGMGMSPGQLFWRVELPLALPLVLEGIRGAATLTIGITTVAALIGAGGLGFFILRGVEGGAPDMVLMGAIPVIGMALVADSVLRWIGQSLKRRAGI